MHTLIIITLLVAGSTDGGAHTAIQKVDFPDKKSCLESAEHMSDKGSVWSNNIIKGGSYKVIAKCLKKLKE